MGLGLSRPELALIPIGLILLWLAIEGVLFLWAFRLADRSQNEARGLGMRGRRRRERFGDAREEAPVMRVCQWCHGKGTLHAQLGITLGLISREDSYEPECPKCDGAGYLDATPDPRRRKALRRKLVEQEWKE
jgi:hypothetical protein